MSHKVNPRMLTIARESRGMTQGQLARAIGVSQGKISKYENSFLSVATEHLERLASVLRYPVDFFWQDEQAPPVGSGCMYHRKRQSLPIRDLKMVEAKCTVCRLRLARLLPAVEIEVECRFHRMDVEEYDGGPEQIAQMVRNRWGLGAGPIPSVIGAIEAAGGVVFQFPFGTRKLDAVSQWLPELPPLFFVNSEIPGDRMRYTLAHEIGHLVMHRSPTADQEREADRFAAELLMPAKDIRSQFKPLSLPRLAALKNYWKVSMAALAKRAFDLARISESYYRKLFTQLSKLGYRVDEPVVVAVEQPTVFREIVQTYLGALGYERHEVSRQARADDAEFWHDHLPDNQPFRLVD